MPHALTATLAATVSLISTYSNCLLGMAGVWGHVRTRCKGECLHSAQFWMVLNLLLRVGAVPNMHRRVSHDAPCMALCSCTLPSHCVFPCLFCSHLLNFAWNLPSLCFSLFALSNLCMESGLKVIKQTQGKAKSVSGGALTLTLCTQLPESVYQRRCRQIHQQR